MSRATFTRHRPLVATGNDGPNIVSLSAYATGANQFYAKGGDDIMNGFLGSEMFWCGDGNDYVEGHAGSDEIHGGPGNDFLLGDGINTSAVNFGNDTVYGDDGDDNIRGGKGIDLIDGGTGNDQLAGDGNGPIADVDDEGDTIIGGQWG